MSVSGALDRLHYESDQCVRYDSDRKLWIYQHAERTIDSKLWPTSGHTIQANSLKPLGWQCDTSKHQETAVPVHPTSATPVAKEASPKNAEITLGTKRTFSESGM